MLNGKRWWSDAEIKPGRELCSSRIDGDGLHHQRILGIQSWSRQGKVLTGEFSEGSEHAKQQQNTKTSSTCQWQKLTGTESFWLRLWLTDCDQAGKSTVFHLQYNTPVPDANVGNLVLVVQYWSTKLHEQINCSLIRRYNLVQHEVQVRRSIVNIPNTGVLQRHAIAIKAPCNSLV